MEGREAGKTSRLAFKQVRGGEKERQTAGWRETERKRLSECIRKEEEDRKAQKTALWK